MSLIPRKGVWASKPVSLFSVAVLLAGCSATTPDTFFDWGVNDKRSKQEKPVVQHPSPATKNASRDVRPAFWWPAKGVVVHGFVLHQPNENAGIDIRLTPGTEIRASAPGKVTYVGDALKSYGSVVIVSHAEDFATVYARALVPIVHRGDVLRAGDVVGHASEKFGGQLHFELRQAAKPLDPVPYLQEH